jgi:hypothetical protein
MKNATTPRRIYRHARTATAHLSFEGTEFGSPRGRTTEIDPSFPVTVSKDGLEEGRLKVCQRKAHRRTVTETWFCRG